MTDNETQMEEQGFKEIILKIKSLFDYFKSKWLIIVFVSLIGGVGGYIYAYYQKPMYTAALTFALEDEKSGGSAGLSGALGLATSLGIDLGTGAGGAFSGANLMELMKSRTLIEKALLNDIPNTKQSLAESFIELTGLKKRFLGQENLKNISFKSDDDRKTYSLQKDSVFGLMFESIIANGGYLSVSQKDKKISIITVEVKSSDEKFSKYFVESLVKEISEFYVETKSKKAKINVAILQKQTDSIRNELNSAITGVAMATDNVYNLNPALNIKRTPSTRKQVDVQANTAILTQLVTNLEMAKVTLLKETPLIQIIDKPIFPLKKTKVGKLKSLVIGAILSAMLVMLLLFIRKNRDMFNLV